MLGKEIREWMNSKMARPIEEQKYEIREIYKMIIDDHDYPMTLKIPGYEFKRIIKEEYEKVRIEKMRGICD